MKKLTATILSMSVLTVMAGAAIAPTLDIIGAHFAQQGVSEMTIKLIISLPALFIILTNLFFHSISRRLSTKTIALQQGLPTRAAPINLTKKRLY